MEAYCMKCKTKREMNEPVASFNAKGSPVTIGVCLVCGTKLYKMGRTDAHADLIPPPKPEKVEKRDGKLVIVESPAKAKTVGRFLGKGYTVRASVGHVRDLLKSQLSVDVDNNFTPKYRVPYEKKEVVKEIKQLAKKPEQIYLATDPDREGESISWHLMEAAGLEVERAKRVVFHEVTAPVVCDKGKPVGIISISDFLSELASNLSLGRDTVGDVMSRGYLVCRDKTSVKVVAKALTETGWRSVLVVDACGKPLGIFSGLDLLAFDDLSTISDETLVTEVMHTFLTISMEANLQDAARTMIENRHHRLLVVDPNEPECLPLGIISSFDIVVEMARPDSVWQK